MIGNEPTGEDWNTTTTGDLVVIRYTRVAVTGQPDQVIRFVRYVNTNDGYRNFDSPALPDFTPPRRPPPTVWSAARPPPRAELEPRRSLNHWCAGRGSARAARRNIRRRR